MSRMQQKYDLGAEAEVRNWFHQLLGVSIGEYELEAALKNGVLLVQLMQKLFAGTPQETLPDACRTVKLKFRTSERAAMQMENIEIFLKAAGAYGVPQSGCFDVGDLFEGRNMSMVMATILQVGSEAQRLKYDGPTIGLKPQQKDKPKQKFTREQLRESHSILSLQHGTNRFASQKGMTFGAVRHCADIRADDACLEGQGEIHLQGGTNKFASQKGMRIGTQRHVSDIKSDEMCIDSQGELTQQTGTNKFASQKGMSFSMVRHGADIKADDMLQESSGMINPQTGWNKGANQSGTRGFGAVRHVSDIRVTELADELTPSEDEDEDEDGNPVQAEDVQG